MSKVIFHGSPCQDFSLAGKQAGGEQDSGTRSSLLWETIRIVEQEKPKYVIWENVKNVVSKKHRGVFDNYLEKMKQLGYKNYYDVLNAKHYGIPQNRERVFCVSIMNGEQFEFPDEKECDNKIDRLYGLYNQATRWGVYDENGLAPTITASMGMGGGHVPMIETPFEFPPKQELKLKLKDMLENEVDEKFYLSNETMLKLQKYGYEQSLRLNDIENTCETINTMTGGHRQPKIEIPEATKKGYAEATDGDGVYINRPHQKRGCVQKQMIQTIKTSGGDLGVVDNLRIRKLTPKECFRLMGFDDTDFEKAAQVNSNSQLYKQAGNSIVVNVLEAIFKELFKNEEHIELIELFGGIGAPRKALQRIRQPHSVIDYVEIDKYAVKSYNAIYGENYEPKDICEYGKD